MTVSCRALGPDFDENRSAGRFYPNSSWNGPLLTFRPRRADPRASKGPILAVLENPLFAYNFFLLWVAEKFVKDETRAKNNFYNKIFRIFGKKKFFAEIFGKNQKRRIFFLPLYMRFFQFFLGNGKKFGLNYTCDSIFGLGHPPRPEI